MNAPQFTFLTPLRAERPYTVSEVNEGVSLILESTNTLVWVEGEISNWKVASSGHSYFKLKDRDCQVPAVMWRQNLIKLDYEPEDGLSVLIIASIKVYRKAGYYQLDCHRMEPRGKGALALAFEKLKKRLENDGLFDPAHKIPLPASIRRLGVITSKQGAVIHDIARVIASRSPHIDIVLIDVPVQGATAAPRIAQAIRDLNTRTDIDCMIVGRGGGSAEDLQRFTIRKSRSFPRSAMKSISRSAILRPTCARRHPLRQRKWSPLTARKSGNTLLPVRYGSLRPSPDAFPKKLSASTHAFRAMHLNFLSK
jgi:hypothetical protein